MLSKCLFFRGCELLEPNKLHLFLLSHGTRVADNEYLESLENDTKLIVCTEKQM